VRRDALLALASADYVNSRDRVVAELLPSEVPAVRERAGRFLADRADAQIVAPVLAALDPEVWEDQALGVSFLGQFDRLEDPAATAWLLRVAANGSNRHEALVLLARFADQRARFALTQWLTSPSGEQDQLLRAVGRYKDQGSAALARRWLEDPEAVRSQLYAAFALAALGEAVGTDRLLTALADGPPELKRVAAQLFTELDLAQHPGARERLLAMLDDADVYVRLYAARALAQGGEARAFARLEAELQKRIPFIRDEVLDIVERAPRAHAKPVIERWMGTSGPLLRAELQRILDRT
jgi:HEAT repeat protein